MKVRWNDDEYVVVTFPLDVLAGLAGFAARSDLQISLVVLPALMETITFIKENRDSPDGEDLTDKLWYQGILGLVNASGSLDDRAIDIAQKILNNPLDHSLLRPLFSGEED